MFAHMQEDSQTHTYCQTDREPTTFSANPNTQTLTLTQPLSGYNLTRNRLHCFHVAVQG